MRSNSARYAAQSDPDENKHFRRRWSEPSYLMTEAAAAVSKPKTMDQLAGDVFVAWRQQAPRRVA